MSFFFVVLRQLSDEECFTDSLLFREEVKRALDLYDSPTSGNGRRTTANDASTKPRSATNNKNGIQQRVVSRTDIDTRVRRGTGRAYPSKFQVPHRDATPQELFEKVQFRGVKGIRFIQRTEKSTVLVYTDGSCLGNGGAGSRAGWAVQYGAVDGMDAAGYYGLLERCGPFGDMGLQTSNRAELRAAIAAARGLGAPKGIRKLVIATDSEYVVDGATKWARRWMEKGWTTTFGKAVKNQDLWLALLGEVERHWESNQIEIAFWRIPRKWNNEADAAAKEAALSTRPEFYFQDSKREFFD